MNHNWITAFCLLMILIAFFLWCINRKKGLEEVEYDAKEEEREKFQKNKISNRK